MSDDNDQETITLMERLMSAQPAPLPPMSPDGGFRPEIHEDIPIPEATEENFVCLRGPCIHYMQMKSWFPAGNTADSLDHAPIQLTRYCIRMPGKHMDLTEEVVHDCSEWCPMSRVQYAQREEARKEYILAKKGQ